MEGVLVGGACMSFEHTKHPAIREFHMRCPPSLPKVTHAHQRPWVTVQGLVCPCKLCSFEQDTASLSLSLVICDMGSQAASLTGVLALLSSSEQLARCSSWGALQL